MANITKSLDLESGSSQRATTADSVSLSITGNLSLECWVKLESAPGTDTSYGIITKTDSDTQRSYKLFYADVSGVKSLRFGSSSDGSSQPTGVVNTTLTVGTWTHLGLSYTAAGGSCEFFVNGVSIGTAGSLATSLFNSNKGLSIGSTGDGAGFSEYFDGLIALPRVWSSVRTGSDYSTNQCTILGATASMAAEWSLTDVYTDGSGNGNTLTPSGSPVFSSDVPSVCAVTGPTNLKSLDTNPKANIKSYDTNVLSNIKSINTNT